MSLLAVVAGAYQQTHVCEMSSCLIGTVRDHVKPVACITLRTHSLYFSLPPLYIVCALLLEYTTCLDPGSLKLHI